MGVEEGKLENDEEESWTWERRGGGTARGQGAVVVRMMRSRRRGGQDVSTR